MAYERGEIYFVRETEKSSNIGRTPFIKVGLVKEKDNRDSFGRLSEHQTGNPRSLFILKEDIVKTDAVTRIEALLHRIYANKRINGEWFLLETEDEVQEVVKKARELAEEIRPFIPKFDEAEKLKKVLSNGQTKEATDFDEENSRKIANAKTKLSYIADSHNEISNALYVIREAGGDVSDVVKTMIRTFKPKFDEKAFKEAKPDIWKKYSVEETVMVSPRLLPKQKYDFKLTDLDIEFQDELQKINELIKKASETKVASMLNDATLRLTNLEGLANWDLDLATVEIQLSIGEFDGITDLYMWKRAQKVTHTLNEGLLMAELPEIYKSFIVQPEPKEYEIKKKKKA